MKIDVAIPGLRLVSEANAHEHWRVRQRRAREQREFVVMILRTRAGVSAPDVSDGPLVVTITRIAPRMLDSDNAVGSAKHARDGVADWLLIDDRDPRVEWRVKQAKGAPLTYAVRIEIERRPTT